MEDIVLKRRERAIVSFLILLFLWGTILTGPFKYFAWMTRDVGAFIMDKTGAAGDLRIFIAYLISILCMIGLFFLGRSKNRGWVCAVCAISSLCFYLIQSFHSIKEIQTIQTIPVYIAVGLALALISAVTSASALEQWLADLFVLSIPVMIVYDALLVPMFSFLKLDTGIFSPWIEIPGTSLFMGVSLLHWPVLVWGVALTAAVLLPAVYFIASKTKGK